MQVAKRQRVVEAEAVVCPPLPDDIWLTGESGRDGIVFMALKMNGRCLNWQDAIRFAGVCSSRRKESMESYVSEELYQVDITT